MAAGLHAVDWVVLVIYLLSVIIIGVLASHGKRVVRWLRNFRRNGWSRSFQGYRSSGDGIEVDDEQQDTEDFFLGGRKLPWWALAASGIASNVDVSGTAINVAMIWGLGFNGFFVEFRGGVTLSLALFLVLGKWTTRSKSMTVAQWMVFRFGDELPGKIARGISSLAMLLQTTLMVTYFCIGSGKFVAEFLSIPEDLPLGSTFWASLLITSLAMIYTVSSGLQGVVWTDVFQGVLIFFAVVLVCIISLAESQLPGEYVMTTVPGKTPGEFLPRNTSWNAFSSPIPAWQMDVDSDSPYSAYNQMGLVIIFSLVKVLLEGTGGPVSYAAQRYLSVPDDRSAGTMSFLWMILLSFRWPFIMAITMLGLTYQSEALAKGETGIEDPEQVMARVLNEYLPIGVKGFVISGLIAAAMSTFDSTINAGAAYWVKDIFQAYIRPNASERTLVWHGRVASITIVTIGLLLTIPLDSIDQVWSFVTISIGGGMIVPLCLRWVWYRFNGWGFGFGTLVGMIVSAAVGTSAAGPYWGFVSGASTSFAASVIASLLTKPVDMNHLMAFYERTRSFGFWGPVRAKLRSKSESRVEDLALSASEFNVKTIDRENMRDAITAYFISWPFQTFLFLSWMCLMTQVYINAIVVTIIWAVFAVAMYMMWYRHLPPKSTPEILGAEDSNSQSIEDVSLDEVSLEEDFPAVEDLETSSEGGDTE